MEDKKWEFYLNHYVGVGWREMVKEYGKEKALERIKKWVNSIWVAIDNKKGL